MLKPYDEQQPAVILELKQVRQFSKMEQMCQNALDQINVLHYDADLVQEGYQIIRKYGIRENKQYE